MVKKLFLIRHGEASQQARGQKDYDRELTPTGFGDAARLGGYLSNNAVMPDLILSSPASRALSTAETIASQLKFNLHDIVQEQEIYEASVRTLFNLITEIEDDKNIVLIVGHNPTLSYLAEYLTKKEIGNINPAGMVEMNLSIESWKQIDEGVAATFQYHSPMILGGGE